MFVHCVKCNRSRWIEEGESATNLMIQQDEIERVQVIDKHIDLISLQARTWNVTKSDTTLPTANHQQPGNIDKQSLDTSDSLIAQTQSLESGKGRESTICEVATRFTCPRCSLPYCSSHSCREHEKSCK